MESNIISLRRFLVIVFLSLFIFAGYFLVVLQDKKTKIVFCDVGQGDSTYIRIHNLIDIVIDAGPDQKILNCLGKHMPFWDRQIELAILSHPNIDHYGGFFYLVERYQINYFLTIKTNVVSQTYRRLIDKIRKKKIIIKYKKSQDKLILGKENVIFFLWPPVDFLSTQDNDYSSVFLFQEKDFKALFTGDATPYALNLIAERTGKTEEIKNIDILKIPHHGSKNGLTEKFLRLANPKVAVISVGKNNSYGHPAQEILDLLKAYKIKIRRTDVEGNIVFNIKNQRSNLNNFKL